MTYCFLIPYQSCINLALKNMLKLLVPETRVVKIVSLAA